MNFVPTGSGKLYLAMNYSFHDDETLTDIITPILNFGRFWKRITVYRLPKTSWINKYLISTPGSVNAGGRLPIDTGKGLPFDGWYAVKVYLDFAEPNQSTYANILSFQAHGQASEEVDKTSSHIQNGSIAAMINYSSDGFDYLYITQTNTSDRYINWTLTLPNTGPMHTIPVNGFALIKYIGSELSLDSDV